MGQRDGFAPSDIEKILRMYCRSPGGGVNRPIGPVAPNENVPKPVSRNPFPDYGSGFGGYGPPGPGFGPAYPPPGFQGNGFNGYPPPNYPPGIGANYGPPGVGQNYGPPGIGGYPPGPNYPPPGFNGGPYPGQGYPGNQPFYPDYGRPFGKDLIDD